MRMEQEEKEVEAARQKQEFELARKKTDQLDTSSQLKRKRTSVGTTSLNKKRVTDENDTEPGELDVYDTEICTGCKMRS